MDQNNLVIDSSMLNKRVVFGAGCKEEGRIKGMWTSGNSFYFLLYVETTKAFRPINAVDCNLAEGEANEL